MTSIAVEPARWTEMFSVRRVLASLSIKDRIAGLDELRGIAVLSVMFAHGAGLTTWFPSVLMPYGMHGVYLFFMVSGYLITKILQSSVEKGSPLSTFYLRRFVRIWPLMIVALVAGALWRPQTAQFIPYNLLLMNNYTLAMGVEQVFRTDVMWSLAIEEQFYLLWPLVVIAAGKRFLPVLIAGIIGVGFCYDSGMLDSGGLTTIRTTHGCMQYIALGAAIAFGRQGLLAALVGIGSFLIAFFTTQDAASFRWIWYGVIFAGFAVTYLTVHFGALISFGPLAHLGQLCYGLYLTHFFVSEYVSHAMPRDPFAAFAVYLAASYGLSLVSLYFIEGPALRLRPFLERSPRAQAALTAVVLLTLLIALVVVIGRLVP